MDKNNKERFYHERLGVFCRGYQNYCDCVLCKKEFAENGEYPSKYKYSNTDKSQKRS